MRKIKKISRFKFRENACALLGVLALVAFIYPQSAAAVSLKHNAMIEGSVITLGDVFAGLEGESADKVLGPAPRPGQDMTLNARTLLRVALAMDLQWRPSSNADFITLRRAATIIDTDMMHDTIKAGLRDEGVQGAFDLAMLSGAREMILPYSEAQSVEIERIRYDGMKNRFEAVLVAPSKDNPIIRESFNGSVERLTEIPVMRHPVKNGDIITADDIDFITIKADALDHKMIMKTADLIGTTPRRMVLAGKPIKDGDIQPPQIVERGEAVTMIYKNGALNLTAQGRALQNGAKGDMIRVTNSGSSKTLEAMVSGHREVMVQDF